MTSYEQQVRIKTVDDMVETMDKIMFGMESHYFTHQYHQVLAINNRLDKMEDKMDKILGKLEYLCASDNEKNFMFTDGSTNYDAICKSCENITKEMLEMRGK